LRGKVLYLATQGKDHKRRKVAEFDSDLTRSMVESIVLKLVSEKALYGYEIIKVVNRRTDGAFQWKEGTLYPVLHRLENSKLIESYWQVADNGRKRKYYSISKKGLKQFEKKSEQWSSFSLAVNKILLAGA
jgi:PadR family transcriptional regulator, regulatory protein PadR